MVLRFLEIHVKLYYYAELFSEHVNLRMLDISLRGFTLRIIVRINMVNRLVPGVD